MIYGPAAASIAEMFERRGRYSGASIAYQIAAILVSGGTPFLTTALLAVPDPPPGSRVRHGHGAGDPDMYVPHVRNGIGRWVEDAVTTRSCGGPCELPDARSETPWAETARRSASSACTVSVLRVASLAGKRRPPRAARVIHGGRQGGATASVEHQATRIIRRQHRAVVSRDFARPMVPPCLEGRWVSQREDIDKHES